MIKSSESDSFVILVLTDGDRVGLMLGDNVGLFVGVPCTIKVGREKSMR